MSIPRAAVIIPVCLWFIVATAFCPTEAAAASRSRSSGGARSSAGRSHGPAGGVSSFRQVPGGYRGTSVRSGGGVHDRRPIVFSPTRPARREPITSGRSPERIRVSPSTSRHPVVRDPAISVGRTTHPRYSHATPRTRHSYYPYYRYYPYYDYYPYYYFGLSFGYPWYSYYRPWYWCSWYDPWGWYPYYSGWYPYYHDWWWDGWGFGGAWYYSPRYDYTYDSPVEVTERVIRSGTPPDYAAADAVQAKDWFEKGRYGDAAEVYRRLSLAEDEGMLAGLAHAHCLLADERYEYAAYVVRKTVGDDPDLTEVFLHLRGYYPDWAVFVNQVVKLERYLQEKPENGAARFLLGYAYLFWDRCDEAASVFRELLAQEPQDRGAQSLLRLAEKNEERSRTDS